MSSALQLASIFEAIQEIGITGNETVHAALNRNCSTFEVEDVGELIVLMCELVHSAKSELLRADTLGSLKKEKALRSVNKASLLIEQLLVQPQFQTYKSKIAQSSIIETLGLVDALVEASGVGDAFNIEDADEISDALLKLLEMVRSNMPASPLRGRILANLLGLSEIFETVRQHGLRDADELAQALTGSIVIYGGKKNISEDEKSTLQQVGKFLADKYQPVRPFVELASLGTNAVLMLGGAG